MSEFESNIPQVSFTDMIVMFCWACKWRVPSILNLVFNLQVEINITLLTNYVINAKISFSNNMKNINDIGIGKPWAPEPRNNAPASPAFYKRTECWTPRC